jgi:glycerol uptake facilitator-like aquaporin
MTPRALAAEFLGTAGLLAVVIGSGIMGERLSGGNDAIALLANSAATVGGLYVLILSLAPISGAHFNPAVTLVMAIARDLPWRRVLPYFIAQVTGAIAGVWIAHAMFALPLLQTSTKPRTGMGQWLGEFVATFGLIACIRLCTRCAPNSVPAAVAAYIGAAYWFTSSTSFANPAVTLARSLSDTFAGIAPSGIALFVVAQIAGALAALAVCRWLLEPAPASRP